MPTKTAPRKTAATRALSATVAAASHPASAAVAAPRSRGKSNGSAAPELKSRSTDTAAKAARSKATAAQDKAEATRVTRDPEQTRQRILDAAKAEFSRVGLGGARVDRIALEAGANKRMLYYYFGNKEDLFLAVLEYTYEHIRNAEKGLHLDEVDPVEAIRRLVTFTWNYYLEYPEFLNLLNSENLHQARHLKNSARVRTMHSPFISMIGEILKRGAAAGVFRDDVDPMQLYISIAGLSYFYLGNNYTLSAIFGRDLKAPKAKADRIAHMNEMVLGFLTHQS